MAHVRLQIVANFLHRASDTGYVGNCRVRRAVVSQRLVVLGTLASCFACAPANPSQDAVTGKWKVEWTCGVETLDLKPDGTFVYAIDFAAGGAGDRLRAMEDRAKSRISRWSTRRRAERA